MKQVILNKITELIKYNNNNKLNRNKNFNSII